MTGSGWGRVELRVGDGPVPPPSGTSVVIVGSIGSRTARFMGTVATVETSAAGTMVSVEIDGIPTIERREAPRFPIAERLQVIGLDSGAILDGVTNDVSVRGMRWTITPGRGDAARWPGRLETVAVALDLDPPVLALASLVAVVNIDQVGLQARARIDAIGALDRRRIEALGWTSRGRLGGRRAAAPKADAFEPIERERSSNGSSSAGDPARNRPSSDDAAGNRRANEQPAFDRDEVTRVACHVPCLLTYHTGRTFAHSVGTLIGVGPDDVAVLVDEDVPSAPMWMRGELDDGPSHDMIVPTGTVRVGSGRVVVNALVVGPRPADTEQAHRAVRADDELVTQGSGRSLGGT